MANVVVFGITGYSGSAIANEFLDRKNNVVGVARNATDVTARDNLTIASGSIHDPEFVKRVLSEADAAIIAVPAISSDGRRLAEALPGVLSAARESETRIGVVGGAGTLLVSEGGPALVDTPNFPDALKLGVAAHRDVLGVLNSSVGVDWFYVSPAAGYGPWAPGPRTGSYRSGSTVLLTDSEGNSKLSAPDLGVAMADEVERPTHHSERFTVAY